MSNNELIENKISMLLEQIGKGAEEWKI